MQLYLKCLLSLTYMMIWFIFQIVYVCVCVCVCARALSCSVVFDSLQPQSWVGKIRWRRDRLPTPVFLGFPDGSAGSESTCNEGDLG